MKERTPGFATPPDHVRFVAKKLFGAEAGVLADGAIAYLAPNGGGPLSPHTHAHDHLFIVTAGAAEIRAGERRIVLRAGESCRVPGAVPHAVWNADAGETVMVGLTLAPETAPWAAAGAANATD